MNRQKIAVNTLVIILLAITLLRLCGDTAPSPQITKAKAWQLRAYLCGDDRIKARHLITTTKARIMLNARLQQTPHSHRHGFALHKHVPKTTQVPITLCARNTLLILTELRR